jgi:hypothetical protein
MSVGVSHAIASTSGHGSSTSRPRAANGSLLRKPAKTRNHAAAAANPKRERSDLSGRHAKIEAAEKNHIATNNVSAAV